MINTFREKRRDLFRRLLERGKMLFDEAKLQITAAIMFREIHEKLDSGRKFVWNTHA